MTVAQLLQASTSASPPCTGSPREDSPKDKVKESYSEPPAVVPKPGEIEDLVRVDRRKLEELILGERCMTDRLGISSLCA